MSSSDGPKAARSAAERKIDTRLRLLLLASSDRSRASLAAGSNPTDDRPDGPSTEPVTVEIAGEITAALTDAITAANGTVVERSPRWGLVIATLPLSAIVAIAEHPEVRRIRMPAHARVNPG